MTPEEAWSAVVRGEDAAVFAYSVAGARLPEGRQARVLAALDQHRANRSRAAALVAAAGGTPPEPEAAYDLPPDVNRAAVARATLADVENALVAVYADAAAASAGDDRRQAAHQGADCAVRAIGWGAEPQAFPT
jgi:hypothetical protein